MKGLIPEGLNLLLMLRIFCVFFTYVPTVSKLQGGAAFNVIPDYVIIDGTFRALSRETLKHLKQRIEQVCQAKEKNRFILQA